MPHDYFSDDDANPADKKAVEQGAETALLPRSFCHGEVSPGDVLKVRVTRVTDDQVEVVKEDSYKEEEQETASLPMPESMPTGGGEAYGMFQ